MRFVRVSKGIYAVLFFALFVFANFFSELLNADSHRAGLTVGLVILGVFIISFDRYDLLRLDKKYFTILTCILGVLFAQYFVSRTIYLGINNNRFLLSYVLVCLVFVLSSLFVLISGMVTEKSIHEIIVSAYRFLLVIAFFSLILISSHVVRRKSMLLFSEPSHFALVFLPLLLYVSYSSTSPIKRSIHIIISLGLAVLVQSMTLLVGVALIICLLYGRNLRSLLMLFTVAGILVVIGKMTSGHIHYFLERIPFYSGSANLSVLAYLSGWERAYLALIDSLGFGLGFQQLGIVGPTGVVEVRLAELHAGGLTLYGGASLAPKLIAELGVLGIFLIAGYLLLFFKYVKAFKQRQVCGVSNIFYLSIFITFFIDLFIRGTGYFSPMVFMFFASIYWIYLSGLPEANLKSPDKSVC